jgi:hypothetical protein
METCARLFSLVARLSVGMGVDDIVLVDRRNC